MELPEHFIATVKAVHGAAWWTIEDHEDLDERALRVAAALK